MKYLPLLLLVCITYGCVSEEIPDLTYNVLDDETVELFEVTDIKFEFYSNMERNVRVFFDSVYDQLSLSQRNRIDKIALSTGGNNYELDPDRDFFLDPQRLIGSTVCYEMAFKTNEDGLTRKTMICVEVE